MTAPAPSEALERVWAFCVDRDWTGWDPYDGLMVRLWPATLLRASRVGRLALTQFMKRSPVNFRPFLRVPRLRNPKALALGLEASVALAAIPEWEERATKEAFRLAKDLVRTAVPTAHGAGWGYPFDWQGRAFWCPRDTPTVVCSGFVVRALDAARTLLTPDPELSAQVAAAIRAASQFVLHDLNRTADENGFCWSYSPLDRSQVVNATLLGAEIVARAAALDRRPDLLAEASPTVRWALSRQNDQGGGPTAKQDITSGRTLFTRALTY